MDDELIEAVRTVYRSDSYEPSQVSKRYGRVNSMEEGGWRVVEVNSSKRTILEFVTQLPGMFTDGQIKEMDLRKKSGVSPGWTAL